MRASIALPLFLILNIGFASNNSSIIALVNDSFISSQSIAKYLDKSSSFDEKIELLNQQIDISLQLDMVKKFGIEPNNEEINGALIQLARNTIFQ